MRLKILCAMGMVTIGLLCGCQNQEALRCKSLHDKASQYAKALRWRETDLAVHMVIKEEPGLHEKWKKALARIEPLECSTVSISCTGDTSEASTVMLLEYIPAGSARLTRKDLPLAWKFSADDGWQVSSPPPDFFP